MDFLRWTKVVLFPNLRTKGLIENTGFPMVIPNKPCQIKTMKNHYSKTSLWTLTPGFNTIKFSMCFKEFLF